MIELKSSISSNNLINGILDLKKRFDKTLENIPAVSEDFFEDCVEVYENHADNLSNNLRLN